MHERFCLNTATIKTAPLDAQIELARAAGFRQIGLWSKDVEGALAAGKSLGEIRAQLKAAGLRVAEVCFLGGWQEAEEGQFPQVLERTHRLCELTRGLGCDILVTIPALKAVGLHSAPDRFRQVCAVAVGYGVRIALEFPGVAAEVKDLRSAQELIAAAGSPNGGLVIDTFHFFLGGSQLADLESMDPEKLFLVHVSDAMDLPLEKLRIPHDNRTFPGDGVIDFGPIFRQFDRLRYDGAISLEIWNTQIHLCDPAEVVQKACASLRRLEGAMQPKAAVIVEG